MKTTAVVGNTGPKVRSDCQVEITLSKTGGIVLNLKSKVQALYGKSIEKLVRESVAYFGIEHALVSVNDRGALPYIIMARIEAAVKQLIETDKQLLPEFLKENRYQTAKDCFRFSRLYLPGNSPAMMLNAGIHEPDGIILDLEDSVAPQKKFESMLLVRNTLRALNFYGAERMVRLNQGQKGLDELKYIIPHNVNLLLLPKVEQADYIRKVDAEIARIKAEHNIEGNIWYMPIIESALGVENAFEIATSSENMASLAVGLEDFTADLGVQRTHEATESVYARTRVVNACKAAGLQPIDSVFSDVSDMDALTETVRISKGLGFEGMGCIHPRQIRFIKAGYGPEATEIEKAKKIYLAFEDAKAKGLGVVSLGSKMIDPPVVKRAERTIKLATALGMLAENWSYEMES